MCLIIDACCANALANADLPQAKLILDWVKSGGKIVSGGKLEIELKGTALQPLIATWKAAGRLQGIDPQVIKNEERSIDQSQLRSNDIHVVALARASGAMTIVTRDKNLMHDLKHSGEVQPSRKIFPFQTTATSNLKIQRKVLRESGCK